MKSEPLFVYSYDDGTGEHLLPADEGGWSLEGNAHATTLVAHYLAEGRVRHRAPYSDKFKIYVAPPRRGSWEAEFIVALGDPAVWAGAAAGAGIGLPTLIFKVLRRVANRATGTTAKTDESKPLEERHSGTFDALVEAVEPSLIRAHRVIISREVKLNFAHGAFKFQFNSETREYIETNQFDRDDAIETGNVASFNVNNRTGRVYFDNLGRTVPFVVHRSADPKTSVAIARSLENYASVRLANSSLRFRFRATRAADGTIKRIVIYSAAFMFGV